MQFISGANIMENQKTMGKQLKQMPSHLNGITVGCSFCFGWELQVILCLAYLCPYLLVILFLIQNLHEQHL